MPFTHRITIVTGHYGTGKTEFAVNLALRLARQGRLPLALADLDNVNPYFRARERRRELEAAGIRLIATSQACIDADVPVLPPQVLSILDDPAQTGVLDIGGDAVGARVLARFAPRLAREDYQLLYVVNANRPEVRTADTALTYLRSIEAVTGLACTGLVNNTHLCGETTADDLLRGAALAEAVSAAAGIPVLCHTAEEHLYPALPPLGAPVFPIRIYMKKPWEGGAPL